MKIYETTIDSIDVKYFTLFSICRDTRWWDMDYSEGDIPEDSEYIKTHEGIDVYYSPTEDYYFFAQDN